MRAQSIGCIVYLCYAPTWRHDVRTTRSVAILGAPGCINTIGLRSLCVRRMLLLNYVDRYPRTLCAFLGNHTLSFYLSLISSHSPPPLPCFIFSLSVTSLARCRINDLRDCRTCELRYLTSIGDTWWLSPQCDKKQERLSISWRNRICIAILLALNKRILPESGS